MGIRLVALDLDGTLLGADRKPVAGAAEALQAVQKKGIEVVLASGRNSLSVFHIAAELGLECTVVSSSGALVQASDRSVMFSQTLSDRVRDRAIDYAVEFDLHLNADTPSQIFTRKGGPWKDLFESRAYIETQIVGDDGLRKLAPTKVLFVDTPERTLQHQQHLLSWVTEADGEVVRSEHEYVEILPAGVDKRYALEKLCNSRGWDSSEVAAIGDWDNDLKMIEWAGYGACVANATPAVKSVAKRIFAANTDGGAIEFLFSIV